MKDYFLCNLCKKVLLEPKECNNCNKAYCSDCLEKEPKPCECDDQEFVELHRFMKTTVQARRFFCPLASCEESLESYKNKIKEKPSMSISDNTGSSL